jgi:hypothetical protein
MDIVCVGVFRMPEKQKPKIVADRTRKMESMDGFMRQLTPEAMTELSRKLKQEKEEKACRQAQEEAMPDEKPNKFFSQPTGEMSDMKDLMLSVDAVAEHAKESERERVAEAKAKLPNHFQDLLELLKMMSKLRGGRPPLE